MVRPLSIDMRARCRFLKLRREVILVGHCSHNIPKYLPFELLYKIMATHYRVAIIKSAR